MNWMIKVIKHTSFLLCIIATGYIILEIYVIKNSVDVFNIVMRYIMLVLNGILIEKYILYLKHIVIKKSENMIMIWLKCSIIYGAFYWGVGVATFSIFSIISAIGCFRNILSILYIIAIGYSIFIIGGFIFGNIIFFYYKYKNCKKYK